MLFGARTVDFQEVAVQATVTYRFSDPVVAAGRIDFSIDPYSGRWYGKPLEQVGTRITELAQQYAVEYISTVKLTDVLGKGIPTVREVTAKGLVGDARLAETSVVVIGVRIVSIRPQADVEKALETPVREKVQQDADAASYERRAVASSANARSPRTSCSRRSSWRRASSSSCSRRAPTRSVARPRRRRPS